MAFAFPLANSDTNLSETNYSKSCTSPSVSHQNKTNNTYLRSIENVEIFCQQTL